MRKPLHFSILRSVSQPCPPSIRMIQPLSLISQSLFNFFNFFPMILLHYLIELIPDTNSWITITVKFMFYPNVLLNISVLVNQLVLLVLPHLFLVNDE